MPPLPSLDRTREGEPGPAAGEQRPERPLCTGGTHRGETGPRCAGIAGLGGAGLGAGAPRSARPARCTVRVLLSRRGRYRLPLPGMLVPLPSVPRVPVPPPHRLSLWSGAGSPLPVAVPVPAGALLGAGAAFPRPVPARCPCRLLLPPVPAGGAGRGRSDAISAKSGPGLNAGRPEKRNWRRRRVPGPPRVPPARRRR